MSATVHYDANKLSAGALALLVHVVFFAALYASAAWQMKQPQGMVVDIWDSLPVESNEQDAPAPPPPPAKQEVQPVTKKVEALPVAPNKADIDLRDKKKKQKEENQKLDKANAKLKAEKQAELAERRLEEIERLSNEKMQAQRKAQEQAAAAAGKVIDEYVGKIRAKIRRNVINPPGVSASIRAVFTVTLLPSGEVLQVALSKSSGNAAYDAAVERAILKSQPLPLPPAEKNMFAKFRELNLTFNPAESGQ